MLFFTVIGLFFALSLDSSSAFSTNKNSNVCCLKDEWEGFMYMEFGTAFPVPYGGMASFGVNASVQVAFSLSRKKVYFNITGVIGTYHNPETPATYDAIYLYDFETKTTYMYSAQDGGCKTDQIVNNLTRQCIPNDSKLLSTGLFGEEGRLVSTYQFPLMYESTWLVTATVSKQDTTTIEPIECGTVYVTFSSPTQPQFGEIYGIQIMDVGPITSTDVFKIPEPCRHLT